MKPKLLITELWGMGDLVIGSPLLRAAVEHYEVTLLAKPYAIELQQRLWPGVRVVPFVAPWTAFKGKYWLWRWPMACHLTSIIATSGLDGRMEQSLSPRT